MKRLITALLLGAFVAPVGADHVYHGWAKYSTDLRDEHMERADLAAFEVRESRPVDIYDGLDRGNSDLYTAPTVSGASTPDPNIYKGFSGPDVSW